MARNRTDDVPSLYSLILPLVAGGIVAACILALAGRLFEPYIVGVFRLAILFLAIVAMLVILYRSGRNPYW